MNIEAVRYITYRDGIVTKNWVELYAEIKTTHGDDGEAIKKLEEEGWLILNKGDE
jgi:hypothetical protein